MHPDAARHIVPENRKRSGLIAVNRGVKLTTRALGLAAAGVTAILSLPLGLHLAGNARPSLAPPPVAAATPAVVAVPDPSPADANPLLDPAATLVAPEVLARPLTAAEKQAIARELARLHTRHAADLVSVIAAAAETSPAASASLLLSIAHTETHGKVLAVSPAGAAGLAQATPAAYLLEGFDGPLYVTNQYLIGTRAFIMKKPLGDAMGIASGVLDRKLSLAEAKQLLVAAKELRQVGMDELAALEPRAPAVFAQRVQAADEYNLETLEALERLLAKGAPKAQLTRFRDRVQKEYRMLLRLQQASWKTYAADLERERDKVLRAHFRQEPKRVILERPYEAGEVLGEKLDARFSPSQMARFLSAHMATKRRQAVDLGIGDDEVEAWTAALYNGGLVNVTRMRAGLLTSIQETQSYMKKVPELRERLDGAAALVAE
jgi:hypothetical protein